MTLGMFVFHRLTTPYQNTSHQLAWRHPSHNRVGARPASQFVGEDAETMSISGVLLPAITGGDKSLNELIEMAKKGLPYPLIAGTGKVYGHFVIEKISRNESEFFADGAARKIEFSIDLKRVEDKDLGNLLKYGSMGKRTTNFRNLL